MRQVLKTLDAPRTQAVPQMAVAVEKGLPHLYFQAGQAVAELLTKQVLKTLDGPRTQGVPQMAVAVEEGLQHLYFPAGQAVVELLTQPKMQAAPPMAVAVAGGLLHPLQLVAAVPKVLLCQLQERTEAGLVSHLLPLQEARKAWLLREALENHW